MRKVRYATLSYPGIIFPETQTVKVEANTTAKSLFRKHKNCYRISFSSRTEGTVDGEPVTGKATTEPTEYLCGRAYTLADMKRKLDPKKDEILISNIEINGYKGGIKCRTGNWQPWDGNVEVVAP